MTRGWKSAWSDPEHVRLAMFRSPGDDLPHAVRGPLPDAENPWLTDGTGEGREPAGRRSAVRVPSRSDEYAALRCACRHIVYADDLDGGFCRFCKCSEHTAQAAQVAA